MSIVRAALITAIIVLPLAAPTLAMARPNDGRFKNSSEALMSKADTCSLFKDLLDLAEKEADKRAGTKAAAPYAKEADEWYAAGQRQGCSWAA